MQSVAENIAITHQRRTVWFGLALAIALDTITQMCWKSAVEHVPESLGLWPSLAYAFSLPLFHLTLLLFLLQFVNWMTVLAHADLSYAQPITALSYVTVSAASIIFFHEPLSSLRLTGLVLILLGVWFISRTDHRTADSTATQQEGTFPAEVLQ